MSMLKYYVWLSQLNQIKPKTVLSLLDLFGTPEALYFAPEAQIKSIPGLSEGEINSLGDKCLKTADLILEKCEKLRISIMPICDAVYPARLKNIENPPIVLYCKGQIPDFDDQIMIGMVGPRNPSAHGAITAEKLAYDLSRSGGVVVSGFASGIDAACHSGAMRAGRASVSVFANGIDICYPRENMDLYNELLSRGTILSEYPPGTPPDGFRFPIRNRIISGLSLGVVIVEAPARSGSLITAGCALEQGRDIFAVPGSVGTSYSIGSNQLIKDGAKPVTSAADILEEYAAQFPHRIANSPGDNCKKSPLGWFVPKKDRKKSAGKSSLKAQDNPMDAPEENFSPAPLPNGLSADELSVVEAFCSARNMHIDSLIEKSGLSADRALSALTMLEIKGVISQLPGKYFERK